VVQPVDRISKAEAIKQQSRQLRGHLARDLADTATPFDGEGYSLLKFHGIYQGYDRDSATELNRLATWMPPPWVIVSWPRSLVMLSPLPP